MVEKREVYGCGMIGLFFEVFVRLFYVDIVIFIDSVCMWIIGVVFLY